MSHLVAADRPESPRLVEAVSGSRALAWWPSLEAGSMIRAAAAVARPRIRLPEDAFGGSAYGSDLRIPKTSSGEPRTIPPLSTARKPSVTAGGR